MQYKVIITGKGGTIYQGINMVDKCLIKGKCLEMFINAKEVKEKLFIGDIVELEETENMFKPKVVSWEACSKEKRLANIKKAYCQWLSCADSHSYTLDNNQEKINGRSFTDLIIFNNAYEILSAYKKLLSDYQKEQGCLPTGVDIVKISKLIKNMRMDAKKIIGVDFDSSFGFNNQTIKNVISTFQKQNNIDGQDDEILDNIHNSNLNYLRQLGQNVFGEKCMEKGI